MEVVFRQLPCVSFQAVDTKSSVDSADLFQRCRKLSESRFLDNAHLQYYNSGIRCGGKKDKGLAMDSKKKLKILKGLSRDLSLFPDLGLLVHSHAPTALIAHHNLKHTIITEAAELLVAQLQQLKSEKKELKRRKKEEKAKMKNKPDRDSSSSSSSESSDGECGGVVQMSSLRTETLPIGQQQKEAAARALVTPSLILTQENTDVCCTGIATSVGCDGIVGAAKRIEVCMGGKCKKSGGAQLLEEFQRTVGVEGAVVGCKCMGKCRDGPNVRVFNQTNNAEEEGFNDSVRTPTNPLCIGVGLNDVAVIVTNFFGQQEARNNLGPTAVA